MLKIAVDHQPKSIIINEADCARAKWIVMDRSLSYRLNIFFFMD